MSLAMCRLFRAASFAVACALLLASCGNRNNAFQYSGTLQAESASVGSTIGGRVTAVRVSAGDRVQRDQVLVQLDGSSERAALAAARAQTAQASAALADLSAGPRPAEVSRAQANEAQAFANLRRAQTAESDVIRAAAANLRQAQAGVRQAQAAAVQAAQNDARITILFREGAVPAQAADDARSADRQARAGVAAARARVVAARAQLAQAAGSSAPQDVNASRASYDAAVASRQLVQEGARAQQIAGAEAALRAAQANVRAARARVDEMTVRAPADGIVEQLDLRPGDLVPPGASVATIDEFLNPFVRIYVTQRDLSRLHVGSQVRVRSESLGGADYGGTVEQIDQSAQFTPRDVQTPEDRAELTFGVKVRVHDPQHQLPPGTTVVVAAVDAAVDA